LKANKRLLVVFMIVLFVILCTLFLSRGRNRMESIAAPLEPPKLTVPQPESRPKESRLHAMQEALQWERDPFTLPSFLLTEKKAEKERVPLKLLAIMGGTRGRVAIIDNEIVGKGDIIAGERVLEIGRDTVTLIQDGSKRVIALKEPR